MSAGLVRRTEIAVSPDPRRVLARIFLPGQEPTTTGVSRAAGVVQRCLALSDEQVAQGLAGITAGFGARHRDLGRVLEKNFAALAHRVDGADDLPADRRRLIGAYFTQEYAVEAAALFNPSMVAHPDQSGLPAGTTRFIMSLRGVGEGHISSIEFRTGVINRHDSVVLDVPDGTTTLPVALPPTYRKSIFAQQLAGLGEDHSSADFVLELLGDTFGSAELAMAIARLHGQGLTRGPVATTIEHLEWIASCNYSVEFPADSSIDHRSATRPSTSPEAT